MTIKNYATFRAWILSELKRNNCTVYRLSKISGVGAPSIHRIIYGDVMNPELETILKLAKAFNTTVTIEPKQQCDEQPTMGEI